MTEKIYKSIPNADGVLMLSEFPRYNSKLNYSASAKELEFVKEIIKTIRNVKAKTGAAPSKKVTLYVKTENKKPLKNSLAAAGGAFLGFILGTGLKLAVSGTLFYYTIRFIFF
jgi:valyl-tRNA synthetase